MRAASLQLLFAAAAVVAQESPASTTPAPSNESTRREGTDTSERTAPQRSSSTLAPEASSTQPPPSSSPAAEGDGASVTEAPATDVPRPSGNSTVDSTAGNATHSTADATGNATSVSTSFTPQSLPVETGPDVIVTTAVLTITSGATSVPDIPGLGDAIGSSIDAATITFPKSSDYWVLQGQDVLQWEPAVGVPIRVRLINDDAELLPHPYDMSVNGFTSMSLSAMAPAKAGSGFKLVLMDMANSTVYAQSEEFEIKEEGTDAVLPSGYESMGSSGGMVQASATSGAVRRTHSTAAGALGWTVGAVVAGALITALL